MEKSGKKITITDVATMAGVSKGTVDRVVHNRGEVSQHSKIKVLEVIEKIGYRPNLYASMLASKKHYRVVCLIPEFRCGEYWELVYRGISRATDKASEYNIEIDVIPYDQFDVQSYRKAYKTALQGEFHALLLAPMYKDDTLAFTSELNARSIPVIYIDSRLDTSNYLAYYGMPMYQSGYLGASLLMESADIKQIANFRIERGTSPQDNPTFHRREGFMAYLNEHYAGCTVLNEYIRPYDSIHNMRVLDSFFDKNPDINHIITFNSRVHLIAEYLHTRNIKGMKLIGYDMLDKNVLALKEGYVSTLIAQRTETQVYRGINAIIEYMILKKTPEKQDNFMSMDILTRHNVDYYFDIHEF